MPAGQCRAFLGQLEQWNAFGGSQGHMLILRHNAQQREPDGVHAVIHCGAGSLKKPPANAVDDNFGLRPGNFLQGLGRSGAVPQGGRVAAGDHHGQVGKLDGQPEAGAHAGRSVHQAPVESFPCLRQESGEPLRIQILRTLGDRRREKMEIGEPRMDSGP